MRRAGRFGLAGLRRRPLLALAAWSAPEAAPAAVSGLAVAHAIDDGFLAGRPSVGVAWLGLLVAASLVGAVGSRQVFRRLGDLVEPFRDDLVRRVVSAAVRRGSTEDGGAVAHLTRQIEIVRDTYAGLIAVLRGFVVTAVAAVLGLLSVAPVVVAVVVPPFLLGVAAFVATLGLAAARERAAVLADERLATMAGSVLAGTRDVVARGAEQHAEALVAAPIAAQARAERSLFGVYALRTACVAVGGWLPVAAVLVAGPWLVDHGLGPGAIVGGVTYVLFGLQPALGQLVAGVGGGGLRFAVTLDRILAASDSPVVPAPRSSEPIGCDLVLSGVTFAYGPHAEPVLRGLDLTIPAGDHVAVVGPSGIGKSTLASLLCGLLRPDGGTVTLGGVPVADLPAAHRVLIPQEAYVFSAPVWDNLTYLRPDATLSDVDRAVAAVGAGELVARLGGLWARVTPDELSAGERQLLALVRSYLAPAPVVVLDEATCHLDPAAERRAEEAFAARGGTLVVVAHRVSSARRARRVVVLDGTTHVVGDHASLLDDSPLYRELLGHWKPPGSEYADASPSRSW